MAENEVLIRRLYRGINSGIKSVMPLTGRVFIMNLIDELVSEDCILHVQDYDVTPNRDGYKKILNQTFLAIPDFYIKNEEIVGKRDKVFVTYIWSGTPNNQSFYSKNVSSSGRKVEVRQIDIYRILDKKIRELWWSADDSGYDD